MVHPGSVVILPVTDRGDVILISNHRHSIGATLWELAAGTLEPPEPIEECAARELEEETGYVADQLDHLGSFYAAPGISTERMHAFLATGLRQTAQNLQPDEHIEVRAVSVSTLTEMIRAGEIEDAKSIASVYLWLLRQS